MRSVTGALHDSATERLQLWRSPISKTAEMLSRLDRSEVRSAVGRYRDLV